jgi:F0F1-type ATP synthase assembly protein I
MSLPERAPGNRRQQFINITLAIVAGQVGCATLIIVIGAILGGLWLDSHFGTKPTFTIALLVLSIPVSVIAMLFLARAAIGRIKAKANPPSTAQREE